MKKHSLIAVLVTAVLLVCVIVNPIMTRAENGINCPGMDNYFNLGSDGNPYTKNGNTVVFSVKSANRENVKVYVNGIETTSDANGNIAVDLAAEEARTGNSETTVLLQFSKTVNNSSRCTDQMEYTFTTEKELADEPVDEETAELEREIGVLDNSSSPIEDLADQSFINVIDPSKSTGLSCNYGKNDGKTIKKYTHTGVVSKSDSCTTTCREDVVVTLDSPVATQSGMCFSYVVDIKTKTVCSSTFSKKKPTRLKGCIAPSNCSSGTHEGGPNSSFDSCIESCDGGDYTQSCINKCYNKVYQKSTTTTKKVSSITKDSKESSVEYLNNLKSDNAIPTPMASTELRKVNVGLNKNVTCYTDGYLAKNTKNLSDTQLRDLAEKVYYSKKYLPGGYYGTKHTWTPYSGYFMYNFTAGTWTWKKRGGCSSDINYYYFSSIQETYNTIKMLNGSAPSTSPTYMSLGLYKQYEPVDGTLKRARYLNSNGTTHHESQCGDTCSIEKKCSNLVKGYSGNKKYIVTNAQANQIYKAELKKYKIERDKCVTSKNWCTNTNSSYTINTDEISKNTGNNLGQKYESNQNVDSSKSGNKSSSSGSFPSMIINTNGLCITGECANNQLYCNSLKKDSSEYQAYCLDKKSCQAANIPSCKDGNTCYDYHTTLSFPKNYINIKTGKTKAEISKTDLPYYVAVGNAYCTSLSTKDVNTKWYNYKLDDTNTVAKPSKINKYNINGTIKNYGIFGWNFDFSCFFAVKNPTTDTCDDNDNCTSKNNSCTGDNCDKDTTSLTSNVKVRSVNLSNLFTNRKARFNWTAAAKNTNNSNYKVDPATLRKEIEKTGDKIFDDDEKYLDYKIELDKNAINKIREYNKKKTYNELTDPADSKNLTRVYGVTVYTSGFLDSLGDSVVKKRGLIGCNNQTSQYTCNTEGGN